MSIMADLAELNSGDVFAGRYVIDRLLGEGDRKKTYLASDTKMDRLVALSFVKPDAVMSDPAGTEREAKILGRIGSHDNVVSLYDFEITADGSAQYMIFEYLGGGTLARHIGDRGPMSLEALLRLGRQLCRGLSHLHDRGLIHRDVSPDNIWLDERLVAHLGDFDSAVTTGADVAALPITTGSYASPEELAGHPVDARSDLYSLGGVLHVAATGARYPGDLSLLSTRADLPTSLADLVRTLLADQPADRPSDATSVLRLLDQVRRTSNIGALVAAGESDTVEFKSSLHHPHGALPQDLAHKVAAGKLDEAQAAKEVERRLRHSVTKTLAAFLNSSGGTLLIGIDDAGAVVGIEADYPHLQRGKQNPDGWLLSLRTVVNNALGDEVWGVIHASLVQHEQSVVAVIDCPPRSTDTWHAEEGRHVFYIRESNATDSLQGPKLSRYFRERWPA
jgi:serine/threonine protein kinase